MARNEGPPRRFETSLVDWLRLKFGLAPTDVCVGGGHNLKWLQLSWLVGLYAGCLLRMARLARRQPSAWPRTGAHPGSWEAHAALGDSWLKAGQETARRSMAAWGNALQGAGEAAVARMGGGGLPHGHAQAPRQLAHAAYLQEDCRRTGDGEIVGEELWGCHAMPCHPDGRPGGALPRGGGPASFPVS